MKYNSFSPGLPRNLCHKTIEHFLKACAGKLDCTEMKMNWVISMSEQSGFPTSLKVKNSMTLPNFSQNSMTFPEIQENLKIL